MQSCSMLSVGRSWDAEWLESVEVVVWVLKHDAPGLTLVPRSMYQEYQTTCASDAVSRCPFTLSCGEWWRNCVRSLALTGHDYIIR